MGQSQGGKAVNPQYEAHERLCKSIGDMAKDNEALKQRIKRLEQAGDALYEGWIGYGFTKDKHLAAWLEAKEVKP